MKAKRAFFLVISLFSASRLAGCPTCVGRLSQSDEPFFSNRFYQDITKKSAKTVDADVSIDTTEDDLGDDDETTH